MNPPIIVEQDRILNGAKVFNLVDAHGLPIMVINAMLREKGIGFDVHGFIAAARKAGWKNRTIRTALLDDLLTPEAKERINNLLP